MRWEYQYNNKVILTAGHALRIYGEWIEAGWILTVNTCFLYVPEIGTPDKVSLLVESIGQEMVVRCRGKEVGRSGISTVNPFLVGEHQRIVGSAPDSSIGDELSLCVMGYLMPLWDWRSRT